jgi:hypothetical protein
MADPKASYARRKAHLIRVLLLFGPILLALGLLLLSFGAGHIHLAAQGSCTSIADVVSQGTFKCRSS